MQTQLGWVESDDTDEWDLFWSDQSISLARAVAMQPMQVIYYHMRLLQHCYTLMHWLMVLQQTLLCQE